MTLTNVIYIPDMFANIVAARLLKNTGYIWGFDNNAIKEGNRALFKLKDHSSGLWLVEQPKDDNYASTTQRSATTRLQKGEMAIWHRRVAHAYSMVVACSRANTVTAGLSIIDTYETV